jgi:ABC-2 type transport system ATP-binding protein
LDDQLTGFENLEFHGRMYKMGKKHRQERSRKMLELVGLFDKKDILIKNYSGGMRRRLEIARGFMHQPKILFLDEPTIGLDVQTRRAIWEYIRKVNQEEKTTIILTTHYMEEADNLCHRISIIDHGKIVITASPKELKDKVGMDIISLRCLDNEDNEKLTELLRKVEWINDIKKRDGTCTLRVEGGEEKIPLLVTVCAQNELPIQTISIRKPTLDDVFLHYTGKTMREEKGSFMDKMRSVHQRHPHMGGR